MEESLLMALVHGAIIGKTMPSLPKKENRPWIIKAHVKRDKEHDKFYDTPAWRKLSAMVKREEPLCIECRKNGIVRAGTVSDHIKPKRLFPELSLLRSNIQRLCDSCHAKKSAWEGSITTMEQYIKAVDNID